MRLQSLKPLSAALLLAAAVTAQSFPDRTVTIHVHGFTPVGTLFTQPYGVDIVGANELQYGKTGFDTVELATLLGRPTILDPGGQAAPDQVTAVSFYGSQAPPYYTAQDVADIAAMEAKWGGGVPKYGWIVAKFVREVLRRSGAEQANIIGVSLGAEATRWMLEKDLEGLVSSGRIARWITHEGVVAGNWAATRTIASVLTFLGLLQAEVDHMNYAWVDANIHSPRTQLDNPMFRNIQVGHGLPVRDDLVLGALTTAIYLVNGSFLPNDGIVLAADGAFADVTPRSRFLGRAPTLSYYDANHFSVRDHEGALAELAAVLSSSRRVKVTVEQAKISNLNESSLPFQNNASEILFESKVTSPWIASSWNISEPVSELVRSTGVPPLWSYQATNTWQTLDHVVFDDFVRDEETVLRLEVAASEIDRDAKYGMFEIASNLLTGATAMGSATVDLSVAQPGSYTLSGPEWDVTLRVEVAHYPIGRSLYLPDEDDATAGSISIQGEAQGLEVAAGPSMAGNSFVVLGGVSGTAPGIQLHSGQTLPINPDSYTRMLLSALERSPLSLPPLVEAWGFRRADLGLRRDQSLHVNFAGVLDDAGRASAVFNAGAAPFSPAMVGATFSYAAVIYEPHTGRVLSVTNPVSVSVAP